MRGLSSKAFFWILGLALLLVGIASRPKPVEVAVHARAEPTTVYWTGRLAEPAIRSGVYFHSILVNHYRSPPHPFPERVRFRVSLRMNLVIRDEGAHHFELDSPWYGALDIDGERVFGSGPFSPGPTAAGDIVLESGVHQVHLLLQPKNEGPEGGIRLLWRTPTETLRPLIAADLTIPESPRSFAFGVLAASPLIWVGGFVLVYLTLRAALVERIPPPRRLLATAAALAALALVTRSAHFGEYPLFAGDELHNAWAGFNLLHEGRPKSWSRLPVYPDKTPMRYFSRSFPIVESAFDHTPLLQILAGASATLLGADDMFQCTPQRIRPPMILLGTASVVLLFFLARKLFGYRAAFVAGLFMAVSPLVVLDSRLVKEEGLVQFLWLSGALLYAKASEKRDAPRLDYLCGVLLGLATLSKIHGIALGAGFAAAAVASPPRNWPRGLRILGTSVAVAALYPVYGLLLDADTYIAVVSWLAGSYPVGGEDLAEKLLILPRFILEPKAAAGIALIDGWILLGWLSLPFLTRSLPIVIPMAAYLLALMATIHSSNLYGFYVIPVLPFLCIAAGRLMERALSRPSFLTSFLFLGLVLLPQLGRIPSVVPLGFRALLFIASLPLVVHLFRAVPRMAALETRMLEVLLALSVLAAAHQSVSTF
jgi:hypothetical protein